MRSPRLLPHQQAGRRAAIHQRASRARGSNGQRTHEEIGARRAHRHTLTRTGLRAHAHRRREPAGPGHRPPTSAQRSPSPDLAGGHLRLRPDGRLPHLPPRPPAAPPPRVNHETRHCHHSHAHPRSGLSLSHPPSGHRQHRPDQWNIVRQPLHPRLYGPHPQQQRLEATRGRPRQGGREAD